MSDYYDRLEQQLSALTARGAHSPRHVSVAGLRFRPAFGNAVAITASVLVAVVVAAVLFTVGSRPAVSHHPAPIGPPLIRNIYPASPSTPAGRPVFAGHLVGRRGSRTPSGEVRFFAVSPTRTEMILTASGLRTLDPTKLYAVWLSPGVVQAGQFQVGGWPPELIGLVEPPVGSSGHLTIVHRFADASLGGVYELAITVQSRTSLTAPGQVALKRFVDF